MPTIIDNLKDVINRAVKYFKDCENASKSVTPNSGQGFWQIMPEKLREESETLEKAFDELLQQSVSAISQSQFTSEADKLTLDHAKKGVYWALRFQEFRPNKAYAECDEDQVIATHPASEDHSHKLKPIEATKAFYEWTDPLIAYFNLLDGTFIHSADYRSVNLNGEVYTLTPTQAHIVKILHKHHIDGVPEVGLAHLLEKVESPSSRLVDIFKSDKDTYNALIKKGEKKGTYRLNL